MVAHAAMPELKVQRQEDHQFKVNLGYTARPCLKTSKQTNDFNLKTGGMSDMTYRL
jgi:hypothetical protein